MPKIEVAKRFTLNRRDGTKQEFLPGEHHVSKADADHWFVKANMVGFEAPPAPNSFEFARAQRAAKAEADAEAAEAQAAASSEAEAKRKAAEEAMKVKTQQAIVQGAKQSLAVATKDDPKPVESAKPIEGK